MSWKEAEEAIIDELRLSKKEDDSNMEDSNTITVEKHQLEPTTTVESDFITPKK